MLSLVLGLVSRAHHRPAPSARWRAAPSHCRARAPHRAQPLGLPAPQASTGRAYEGPYALSASSLNAEGNICVAHGTACCTNPKGLEFCVGTLVCKDGECSGFEQDKQQQGTQEKQQQEKQAAPGEGPRLAKTEAESQAATPPGKKEDIAITG